jgi:hypothetical protein
MKRHSYRRCGREPERRRSVGAAPDTSRIETDEQAGLELQHRREGPFLRALLILPLAGIIAVLDATRDQTASAFGLVPILHAE